jgi:hypothetical protein
MNPIPSPAGAAGVRLHGLDALLSGRRRSPVQVAEAVP